MSDDPVILLADTNLHVTVRGPFKTVRRTFETWGQLNHYLTEFTKRGPAPEGTVLTVEDWTGKERYIVRGGGPKEPPTTIKLTEKVRGLPENPKFEKKPTAPELGIPGLDFPF